MDGFDVPRNKESLSDRIAEFLNDHPSMHERNRDIFEASTKLKTSFEQSKYRSRIFCEIIGITYPESNFLQDKIIIIADFLIYYSPLELAKKYATNILDLNKNLNEKLQIYTLFVQELNVDWEEFSEEQLIQPTQHQLNNLRSYFMKKNKNLSNDFDRILLKSLQGYLVSILGAYKLKSLIYTYNDIIEDFAKANQNKTSSYQDSLRLEQLKTMDTIREITQEIQTISNKARIYDSNISKLQFNLTGWINSENN